MACLVIAQVSGRERDLGVTSGPPSVTLDSGRGKRRLKDVEGTRVLEGLLQEGRRLGASSASLSNDRLCKMTQGFIQRAYLKSSTKTLRVPGDKGELSRFKVRRKYRGSHHINTWGPGTWTKQCSWQESQDGYKWKSGPCDRRKKAV